MKKKAAIKRSGRGTWIVEYENGHAVFGELKCARAFKDGYNIASAPTPPTSSEKCNCGSWPDPTWTAKDHMRKSTAMAKCPVHAGQELILKPTEKCAHGYDICALCNFYKPPRDDIERVKPTKAQEGITKEATQRAQDLLNIPSGVAQEGVKEMVPCSCPKGGMDIYGNDIYGNVCRKCDGVQYVAAPQLPKEWETSFDEDVERYISDLAWTPIATDEDKTLVAGNIRSFAAYIKRHINLAADQILSSEREAAKRRGFKEAAELSFNREDNIRAHERGKVCAEIAKGLKELPRNGTIINLKSALALVEKVKNKT